MKTRNVGRRAARYLLVGAMSAVMVGCGGGGGDDGTVEDIDLFDPDDVDGDGTPNLEDEDYDPRDLDGDGILNLDDDDVDGDGILNEDDDDFVENDADGDGNTDPTEDMPCGDEGGSDAVSANNTWDDNCGVSRFGQFRNSLYMAGIQRVVYCSGFGEATVDRNDDGVMDVDDFADGDGGPATFEALGEYQAVNSLTPDRIVGPGTWGSLQTKLVSVDPAPPEGGVESYTVAGERCGGEVLFYQDVGAIPDDVTQGAARGGWELSSSAGSSVRVPFSTAQTAGRLD